MWVSLVEGHTRPVPHRQMNSKTNCRGGEGQGQEVRMKGAVARMGYVGKEMKASEGRKGVKGGR